MNRNNPHYVLMELFKDCDYPEYWLPALCAKNLQFDRIKKYITNEKRIAYAFRRSDLTYKDIKYLLSQRFPIRYEWLMESPSVTPEICAKLYKKHATNHMIALCEKYKIPNNFKPHKDYLIGLLWDNCMGCPAITYLPCCLHTVGMGLKYTKNEQQFYYLIKLKQSEILTQNIVRDTYAISERLYVLGYNINYIDKKWKYGKGYKFLIDDIDVSIEARGNSIRFQHSSIKHEIKCLLFVCYRMFIPLEIFHMIAEYVLS